MSASVDPVWEQKYATGHAQRYPWDCVVSFVFRNAPPGVPRDQIRVLELGFGAGSNLWFAAREGFSVCGIDGSPSAVAAAQSRLAEDGLCGDLHLSSFPTVPEPDDSCDLVIDRASLTCVAFDVCRETIREVHRVLKPGGRFFMNVYGDDHSSAQAGEKSADGRVENITGGTLTGVGGICFYGQDDLRAVLGEGWRVVSRTHVEVCDADNDTHSEWRVVVEKQA
ncbi:MAG: class I SAM-dependent methyltransferase [Phycisphaerales bacterium]|nr:class I SAM-dependent methyltransferase [Phycisphaerales bacterium]